MKCSAVALVFLMVLNNCQAVLRLRTSSKKSLRPTARFVASESASKGSAPWQVSVQNQYGNHISGGVIIADNYVLTAASSVAALDKRNIKVLTGTNNWMESSAQHKVESIKIHFNYDKPLYHNDVALIKLTRPIDYDENTRNIILADLDEMQEGDILTMTGWGSTKPGAPYSENLRKLDVPYISNADCIEKLGPYGNDVDLGHLCVLPKKGSGACHGDTGGPLVNSQKQLVGIGNWGIPCGHGFPDVYARISFYSDWIRTSMKGCTLKN